MFYFLERVIWLKYVAKLMTPSLAPSAPMKQHTNPRDRHSIPKISQFPPPIVPAFQISPSQETESRAQCRNNHPTICHQISGQYPLLQTSLPLPPPGYAIQSSHNAYLDASRQIIHAKRLLEKEDNALVPSRMQFAGILQCLFMAYIVLAGGLVLPQGSQRL